MTANEQASFFDHKHGASSHLQFVYASFQETKHHTFDTLLVGCSRLRVLTYSSSIRTLHRIAKHAPDMEIIFGREDIIHTIESYFHFQKVLLDEVREVIQTSGDRITTKIANGHLRLYVVSGQVHHGKIFLIEGDRGTCVVVGSPNFSEMALLGQQGELPLCFFNDENAWTHYSDVYETIKQSATQELQRMSLIQETLDVDLLPALAQSDSDGKRILAPTTIVMIQEEDASLGQPVMSRLSREPLPAYLEGLGSALKQNKGGAYVMNPINQKAASVHIRKTPPEKTDTFQANTFTIDIPQQNITFRGHPFDADSCALDDITRDVHFWYDYFDGYRSFRGDTDLQSRKFFMFVCWLYISPFLCSLRAYAMQQGVRPELHYPLYGILHGKSNCGKTNLIEAALMTMFGDGTQEPVPKKLFTKTRVPAVQAQYQRTPVFFDDIEAKAFNEHGTSLIKEDRILADVYPGVVISMNSEQDHAFPPEIRKRSLLLYANAVIPHEQTQRFGKHIQHLKTQMSTDHALYRVYVQHVLNEWDSLDPETDILNISSRILCSIFDAYGKRKRPEWAVPLKMEQYERLRYETIRERLLVYWQHDTSLWTINEHALMTLKVEDPRENRRIARECPPDILKMATPSSLIFHRPYLANFLEVSEDAEPGTAPAELVESSQMLPQPLPWWQVPWLAIRTGIARQQKKK